MPENKRQRSWANALRLYNNALSQPRKLARRAERYVRCAIETNEAVYRAHANRPIPNGKPGPEESKGWRERAARYLALPIEERFKPWLRRPRA